MADYGVTNPIEPDTISAELLLETARAITIWLEKNGDVPASSQSIEVQSVRGNYTVELDRVKFWFRMIPQLLDPRRIVALADRAARNPDWWQSCRIHFFCPEMTHREIAGFLHLKPRQVQDYIYAVHLNDDCYANLPDIYPFKKETTK